MLCFRNVVSQRWSLKEFQLFPIISLLNVCFKIFCRKYRTPGGEGGGEPGVGEEEEDEGGNFKFLFFSVNVNTVNRINLIFFL